MPLPAQPRIFSPRAPPFNPTGPPGPVWYTPRIARHLGRSRDETTAPAARSDATKSWFAAPAHSSVPPIQPKGLVLGPRPCQPQGPAHTRPRQRGTPNRPQLPRPHPPLRPISRATSAQATRAEPTLTATKTFSLSSQTSRQSTFDVQLNSSFTMSDESRESASRNARYTVCCVIGIVHSFHGKSDLQHRIKSAYKLMQGLPLSTKRSIVNSPLAGLSYCATRIAAHVRVRRHPGLRAVCIDEPLHIQ